MEHLIGRSINCGMNLLAKHFKHGSTERSWKQLCGRHLKKNALNDDIFVLRTKEVVEEAQMTFVAVDGLYKVDDNIQADDIQKLVVKLGIENSFKLFKNQQMVVKGSMQVAQILNKKRY
eukprot:Platyproteum_vivax@DN12889_c0_g1_i1.p1